MFFPQALNTNYDTKKTYKRKEVIEGKNMNLIESLQNMTQFDKVINCMTREDINDVHKIRFGTV